MADSDALLSACRRHGLPRPTKSSRPCRRWMLSIGSGNVLAVRLGREGARENAIVPTGHIDQITSDSMKANRRLGARGYLHRYNWGMGPCWTS